MKAKKAVLPIAIICIILLFCFLIITKRICINPLFAYFYPVQGVDVSHYQGTIDWEILSGQGISFAFIKATEGSGYVDEKFADNWKAAGETELYVGAYHFFSFDSEAASQAELYIHTVGNLSGKLAPVVDVEYYGDKRNHPPNREDITRRLQEFLRILEEYYQTKPIIYTTYEVYETYIKGSFDEYPLWIRNIYFPPVDKNNHWQFWQYSDTTTLEGYQGTEVYIDLNVFRGSLEELEKFTLSTNIQP